jgi:hypothetical protein
MMHGRDGRGEPIRADRLRIGDERRDMTHIDETCDRVRHDETQRKRNATALSFVP